MNGDGIGDTPYIINENNQDNYPLMKPFAIPEFLDTEPPQQEPPSDTTPQESTRSEPFPTAWVAASIALIAAVVTALPIYFTKIKKSREKLQ